MRNWRVQRARGVSLVLIGGEGGDLAGTLSDGVSKFAKAQMAKPGVIRGTKTATTGGLTKAHLTKNKSEGCPIFQARKN